MKKSGFNDACEELSDAKEYYSKMRAATKFESFRSSWKRFLFSSNRVYNKLLAGSKGDPFSTDWIERKLAIRNSDPLLHYLNKARDAAEHGLGVPVDMKPGRIAIYGDVNINSIRATNGIGPGSYIDIQRIPGGRPAHVHVDPASPCLIEVVDTRFPNNPTSRTPVPKEHLGSPLARVTPAIAAELAITYLDDLLAEAKSRLL